MSWFQISYKYAQKIGHGPRENDWLVSQKEKFQNSKIFVSFLFLRKKLIKFKLNQACKKNRSKAIIVLIILPQPLLLILMLMLKLMLMF